MKKLSEEEIESQLKSIRKNSKKLHETISTLSKQIRVESNNSILFKSISATGLTESQRTKLAKQSLKILFLDPKWSYRKFTTISNRLPDYNEKNLKNLLREIGAVKSSIDDMYGNELWKNPGPVNLAKLP